MVQRQSDVEAYLLANRGAPPKQPLRARGPDPLRTFLLPSFDGGMCWKYNNIKQSHYHGGTGGTGKTTGEVY